jgi:hypothetical protein
VVSGADDFELDDPVTVGTVQGYVAGYLNAPFVKVRHLDGQVAHYPRGTIRRGHVSESDSGENN